MRRSVAAIACVSVIVGGCGSDGGDGSSQPLYSSRPVPAVPDRSSPIDPSWVEAGSGTLGTDVADGTYWADAVGIGESGGDVSGRFVSFDLSQALFGPSCVSDLGSEACEAGFGVIAEPHGELPASVGSLEAVSVVGADRRNHAIDGNELWSLVAGEPPDARAPDTYSYVAFPFLLTVRSGQIVRAEQIWIPGDSS